MFLADRSFHCVLFVSMVQVPVFWRGSVCRNMVGDADADFFDNNYIILNKCQYVIKQY